MEGLFRIKLNVLSNEKKGRRVVLTMKGPSQGVEGFGTVHLKLVLGEQFPGSRGFAGLDPGLGAALEGSRAPRPLNRTWMDSMFMGAVPVFCDHLRCPVAPTVIVIPLADGALWVRGLELLMSETSE